MITQTTAPGVSSSQEDNAGGDASPRRSLVGTVGIRADNEGELWHETLLGSLLTYISVSSAFCSLLAESRWDLFKPAWVKADSISLDNPGAPSKLRLPWFGFPG